MTRCLQARVVITYSLCRLFRLSKIPGGKLEMLFSLRMLEEKKKKSQLLYSHQTYLKRQKKKQTLSVIASIFPKGDLKGCPLASTSHYCTIYALNHQTSIISCTNKTERHNYRGFGSWTCPQEINLRLRISYTEEQGVV